MRDAGLRPVLVLSLALGLLVLGTALTGRAGLLDWTFPAAALMVGLLIYRLRPLVYVGFAWWIWLISPGVRRIADYQSGWNAENPISLTPLLVGVILIPSMIRNLPKFSHRMLLPFLLMALGILYGFAIGITTAGLAAATYAMLTWLVPLILGAHLALQWQHYPEQRAVIGKTYLAGLIATGAYGLLQFIQPLPWDRYWMMHVDMTSIGAPEPFRVRVFSFMNAPGPFGYVVASQLLFLLGYKARLRLPALVIGATGLLISLVRSAWIGLACGALTYLAYLPWRRPGRALLRNAAVVAVVTVGITALANTAALDPLRQTVSTRFATLAHPANDVSLRARTQLVHAYVDEISSNFVGNGLGSTGTSVQLSAGPPGVMNFDNGVLEVFFALGWPGATLFFGGLAWLILPLLQSRGSARADNFARAARAGGICMLVQAVLGNVFVGVMGAALYTAIGILSAAQRWHSQAAPADRTQRAEPVREMAAS
jgi:hypothetical protein